MSKATCIWRHVTPAYKYTVKQFQDYMQNSTTLFSYQTTIKAILDFRPKKNIKNFQYFVPNIQNKAISASTKLATEDWWKTVILDFGLTKNKPVAH